MKILSGLRNRYSTLMTPEQKQYGQFGIESLSQDDYGIDEKYFTLDDSSGGNVFQNDEFELELPQIDQV